MCPFRRFESFAYSDANHHAAHANVMNHIAHSDVMNQIAHSDAFDHVIRTTQLLPPVLMLSR